MLSADVAGACAGAILADQLLDPVETTEQSPANSDADEEQLDYDPASSLGNIFEDVSSDSSPASSESSSAPESDNESQPGTFEQKVNAEHEATENQTEQSPSEPFEADELPPTIKPDFNPVSDSMAGQLTQTLRSANGPPADGLLESASPLLEAALETQGAPVGITVTNLTTFSQELGETTTIRIGGTDGPGIDPTGHDQFVISGLAELDGTLQIQVIGSPTLSAGDTFVIFTWGSRTGEFANWRGTTSIPGHPELAFVPVYNANDLTLQVVSTHTIVPTAETALQDGLVKLQQIANGLDGIGELAEDLPLIGSTIGAWADAGQGINDAIRGQLNSLLALLPNQSQVTSEIESWDGTTVAGFEITILGVLGHYGTNASDPFSWDINLQLTQTHLNQALSDVAGAVLDAAFDPSPMVDIKGTLEFQFTLGYDADAYVEIQDLTARATVDASGTGGFAFDLTPPGAPLNLDVTSWSVAFDASVTATPDDSVLTSGRITRSTLTDIASGTINVGDAFNLTHAGTVDASFVLDGALTGFVVNYTGTHTVRIQSDDLFSGTDPDLTIEVDGSMEILGQTLEGVFTLKKTATETVVLAEDVVYEATLGVGGSSTRILRVENGSGKFLILGDELAGTATLTITAGPDLPNIDISGTTLNLAFNTSPTAVSTIDGETVSLPAGPYYRLSGNASIVLTTPNATLTGDFVFEPNDTDANPANGDEEFLLGVANLQFTFDEGASALLTVTNGSGAFVFTDAGVAGSTTATVALNVSALNLTGTFHVRLNDTNTIFSARTVDVNGMSVSIPTLPAGPYLRVEATGAQLTVLGIGLTGDFVFESKTTSPGGLEVVTVAASNVQFDLGTLANDLLNISNVAGAFIITSDGIAGQASADVTLNVTGVSLSGSFTVRINDTEDAVDEMVDVGGSTIHLDVPAGPYLQVQGTGVTLDVFGVSITGDFSFEQRESTGGTQLVVVRAGNVAFDFGTSLLTANNGTALFVFTDLGMAGQGSIDVTVSAFNNSFTQPFSWSFNNTGSPIDEEVGAGPGPGSGTTSPAPLTGGDGLETMALPLVDELLEQLDLPAGPFNRLSYDPGSPFGIDINIGGQMQSFMMDSIVLTLVDADPDPDYITVGVAGLSSTLSAGVLSLDVSGGTGALVIYPAGVAGVVTVNSASLSGATGISVTATELRIEFNGTGADVGPLSVSISDDAADDVTIEFTGAYYHDYLAVAGAADIDLAGFVVLSGVFRFEKSDADPNTFKVAAEDLTFDLKVSSLTVASFNNGTGAFVISNGGLAGVADVEFEVGLVGMSGDISLEVNTTTAAVNTTVTTPSGSTVINLTETEYLRIYVNGYLHIGSVALPFNFTVEVDTGSGTVEFRNQGDNSLLLSIDASGNITTGLSFDDFAAPGPFEFVGMLRQLLNWMDIFKGADVFNVEIPFTGGSTVGDFLDWSQLFLDEIYSNMISVELQSRSLTATSSGTLSSADFQLKIGDDPPVPVSVSGAYGDWNDLVTRFNTALMTAGLAGSVVARINERDTTNPDDDLFVLALTPTLIATDTTLSLVTGNTEFNALGFGPGDADDTTVDQVGIVTERYDTPGFFEELGNLLGLSVVYNEAQQVYTYMVDKGATYSTTLPFDFGGDLGSIAGADLSGELNIAATVSFQFTLGFDLGAGEVPRVISSSLIPAPANGRISEDAHFEVFFDNALTPVALTLPKSYTDGTDPMDLTPNNNLVDLAKDLNRVFKENTYNSTAIDQLLYAQKAGTGLAISVINEDYDGDGMLGTVNEDTNGNGRLDTGEDLDGDGVLDRVEDLNGDGNLDNQLGLINKLTIRSEQDDIFATELGFGAEALEIGGTSYFQTTAKSTVKGLFVEDVQMTGSLEVTTTTPINGSLRFGFVEISTTGGSLGTLDYDGTTPAPISVSIGLADQTTGDSRFYIADLMNGIESANLGNFIEGPNFEGSFLARLPNISVGGLGFSFPLGSNPEVSLWIPDINHLDYNSDPYDGTNTGIFLTYPDFGNLNNFQNISFAQIIQALKVIADNLGQLSAFSFLDERLPIIDISINDMIDYASKFADLIDAAAHSNSQSLQSMIDDLETQIEQLFNLNPDILTISLDDGGIASTVLTTTGGVNNSAASTTTINPDGENNGFIISNTNLADAEDFNATNIQIVGSPTITGDNATVTWDDTNKILKIEINGSTTTTNTVITAINGLSGHPWTATKVTNDNTLGSNTGDGTFTTTSLKFAFDFTTAYANTFPLQLDLNKLVKQLAGQDSGIADFLDAVTTFIQVEGEAQLTVSASAALTLDFGLDLTNPSTARPFFYDSTGVVLTAKVLGSNIEFSAAVGAIVGIVVHDGSVTIDQDGNPETDAGDGDKGALFRLGLRDNNGDGRHYFSENWFDFDNIDLHMEGGVSAVLPVFTKIGPSEIALGNETDGNGDGYPDNYLVIDIPDLVRLFVDTQADMGVADVRIPGGLNNLEIINVAGDSDNFKVVFEQNGSVGSSANAAFANNTLTIQINSGSSTATSIKSAVEALGGGGDWTVSFLDDDPSGSNNGSGTVTVSKLILIAPDISSLFEDVGVCDIIDQHAGVLLDGLDSLLGTIQDGLEDVAYSTSLPLIGNGFAGAANFISDFRSGLLRDLRDAVNSAGSATAAIENAIKQAFWNTLGPDGLDILVDPATSNALDPSLGYQQLDVTLDCDTGLVVNLRLAKSMALVDTSANPIDFDIGVPGFGLAVEGNVILALGFDLKFGFGLNKEDGFFFDSSATAADPELRVYLEATIPGLAAKGTLAFLQLDVADNPDDPSHFTGQFVVDLRDPNGDGKLTFAEMTSSGTTFKDIVDANLEAVADINLDLAASFGGNTSFPRVVAEFHLDWAWDLQNGAGAPTVAFTNVALDLGTFISDFMGPILEQIRKVTEPLQPIVDIVTARLPVLSDLAGETITLLDLAAAFGLLEPSTVKFIDSVIQVINIINELDGIGEGSILIPFGSFTLNDDGTGNRNKIQVIQEVAAQTADELNNAINNAGGPGASSTYKSKTSGFVGDVNSLDNFSIPIFKNPAELFNLFTGGTVRLIEWRMPTFKFEFTYIQKIPIYPPLYAQFGGRIGATINIGFGYDTFGIQKFIASEDKNVLDLLDGFYVLDFDANGNDQPELSLSGEIFAGASIDLLIVEAGVRGGIFATIDFDLNDVDDDGKVRVSEIIALAQTDPRCIFNIHGELGLFLEAFLSVDLFFFSIDKTWRFAEITLFSFDITCPEPELATEGASLTLNMGPNAGARGAIDTSDGSETFIVAHVDGTAGDETVEVRWGDYKDTYEHVAKIVADGGQGDDYIDLRGVQSPVEIDGGVGNDTIFLSDGTGSIVHGNDGNDTITASTSDAATNVTIYGDAGNDTLVAGAAGITIYGGAGRDTITGSALDDELYGDEGDDTIDAGKGNDYVEGGAGNDTIEGGAGIDYLIGGAGRDILRGSRDDDILDGGDGDDELYGGSGNDLLIGGDGNDLLNGHAGIDLLIGDRYSTVNNQVVSISNISGILAAIPTDGVSVEGLTGSGNDVIIGGGNVDVLFGGEGNDLMYGGNFLNKGETDTIEEDANDFFDGGPGNDTIFGDDSMGREGDRNTGIAIKSAVFYDNNLNGLQDDDEAGVGGVTVKLIRQSTGDVLATVKTESDGSFEFVGLDPLDYRLKFFTLTGLSFAVKNAGGASSANEAGDDSDADTTTGETDPFHVGYDTTESNVTAGYTGNPTISVNDVSVNEGNVGQTQLVFTIKLSGPAGSTLNIPYSILNGSATAASGDYAALSNQTLVINQGEVTAQVAVTVFSDSMYEDNEQFLLSLTNPFGAGTIQAFGTIINDDPIPTISIQDYLPPSTLDDAGKKVYEVGEGTTARFVVTLSNPSQYTVTVEWRTDVAVNSFGLPLNGAATPSGLPGADYQVVPNVMNPTPLITFEPGETTQVVEVQCIDDTLDEVDEEFYVDLFNPAFARIEDGRAFGIIPDDDAPVSVSIAPTGAPPGVFTTSVTESNNDSKFVDLDITLSEVSGKTITVTFATSPGTAVESVFSGDLDGDGIIDVIVLNYPDYVAIPDSAVLQDEALLAVATPEQKGELVFAPGDQTKTITVEVLGDNLMEDVEEFFVNLLSADNADIAANAPAESNHVTINIGNDDATSDVDYGPWAVRFSDSQYIVEEPDSGTDTFEVTLLRTPGSSNAIVVFYTVDGTATAGLDYEAVFRQLVVFGENETSRKIPITIYSDNVVEGDETVKLYLRAPTGQPARGDPNEATLIIRDEDTPALSIVPPVFSIFPTLRYGLWEGSSGGTGSHDFNVYLSAPAGPGGVTVHYETVPLTARDGQDFVATSGNLFIPANSSSGMISVDVYEDTDAELSEEFAVRLSNPVGATLAVEDSTAVATIYDDDGILVNGTVFYDKNGNGYKDFGENGIKDVDVTLKWYYGGVEQSAVVSTNGSGVYSQQVYLGQVSIEVDGTSVTSPYKDLALVPIFLGFGGSYENTTNNDTQSIEYDGIVGISPFGNVGYDNSLKFSIADGSSDDTGRGGTDDTIFGGPGNDIIDAGGGDDHVVGGHWMTATDGNAPVNMGTYNAVVTATTNPPTPLHSVYDAGPIFSVDTSGDNANGSISGQIWLDANNNNRQDAGELFTEEVLVNLYDCNGNPVNTIVTTDGTYQFTGLYLHDDGSDSHYVVEFDIPNGFTFVAYVAVPEAVDTDVIVGGRTSEIILNNVNPSASNQDAGIKPSDLVTAPASGGFGFSEPSYSVSEAVASGVVTITVVRGNSFEARVVIVRTEDGTALDGVNYLAVSILLTFDVGETQKSVDIPILDTDSLGLCIDPLYFNVVLRDPTGRPLDDSKVYIGGDAFGNNPDDDIIQGGNDWDILIGDSGYIPAPVVIADPSSLNTIVYSGGPGKDTITGGLGGTDPDFINGQLEDDILIGDGGEDIIRGGLGDDLIYVELDNKDVDGEHGTDTIVSNRDVPFIILTTTGPTSATLVHKQTAGGFPLSTFTLESIEVAKLFGGYRNNTFDLTGWNGSAYISGGTGTDSLIVENDASQMILKDASFIEGILFQIFQGFFKDASLSLPNGSTYHLGSIENVTLRGGPSNNVINASGFSRSVTFEGTAGNDVYWGGSGNDTFHFVADSPLGTNTVIGNGGRDTLSFVGTLAGVDVDLAVHTLQLVNGNLNLFLTDDIENVTGGSGNDFLYGNGLNNVLLGGPGDDWLEGRAGSEIYVFDTDTPWGSETVTENIADSGYDIIDFSGTTTQQINLNLSILGSAQVVNSNLTLTIVGEGVEEVIGGSLNDTLRGNSNDNVLRGGPGNDLLDGKSGDDTLDGGPGNDNLNGGAGTDTINEVANTNFTLSDSSLSRSNGEVDALNNIEIANLTGGVRRTLSRSPVGPAVAVSRAWRVEIGWSWRRTRTSRLMTGR